MNSHFLPPLDDERNRIAPADNGKWQRQEDIAYSEVADSLARAKDMGVDTKSISSLPDMWARPLLIDMVLKDFEHPLHASIEDQWKGMLAVIALAEVKNIKLQAQLLNLDNLKNEEFIKALLELLPSSEKTAYQLTEKVNGKNRDPWKKIYVFLLNGQAVGMTSPATLVCPSEDGQWDGVPWWHNGRLHSPLESSEYLTEDDKIQLFLWLDNLRRQLNEERGDSVKLKEILKIYQEEIKRELKVDPNANNSNLILSNKVDYFGIPLTLGKLDALSIPIRAKKIDSSVKMIFVGRNISEEILFIPDTEQLCKQWTTKQAKDIWIYGTSNVTIFNKLEFDKKYKEKVKYLSEDDIFAESFYYLKEKGNLPGSLLPENIDEITYTIEEKEYSLTPLLPIKTEILKYLTPEELIERIEFLPTNIGNQSGVTVKLKLLLSGGEFVIQKNYLIESANAITSKPYLEIWPNFKSPDWKTYYAFYFDNRTVVTKENKIFLAVFPESLDIHPIEFKNFQITRLESFPGYVICQDEKGIFQGIILLKAAPTVGDESPSKTWTVGVDFGTSFTNIYYQINGFRNALTLSPLHLQVTSQDRTSRSSILFDYFMSARIEEFPLTSVLTVKGSKGGKGDERPIFDGRVYILEDVREFDPNQDDIKINLKWKTEHLLYNRIFLNHLAWLVAAEAAKNHVRKIDWSISYPSAFSRADKSSYKVTWQRIIEDLCKTTGISNQWLAQGYRAESSALAHYFADEEGKDLLYTTCIDMGGGTSDISIWVGNNLVHQCSVQLAGRNLFSQFWKNRPDFLSQQFETDLTGLTSDEPFFVKLDGLLSVMGSKWLESNRSIMDEDPNLNSIVLLSSLGVSGLYYYIGLVLKALDVEGKYPRQQNTPVYIGGNGSRILNWLDQSGRFTEECDASLLFSRMLSKGSGFEDTKVPTVLSSKPKAEVACGLVLDQNATRLKGLQYEDEDIFAGEACKVNGESFDWNDRLNLTRFKEINSFTLLDDEDSGLANLKVFLDDFHYALKDLRITNIKSLKQYDNVEWRNAIWRKVERRVEAELLKTIGRSSEEIRVEPPFILGLKALLKELSENL